MIKTNENTHHMGRRSMHNDYRLPGTYHITIRVNDSLHQPLGRMAGNISAADGTPDAPHVELTDVGVMVEQELVSSISKHYPMVEVQEHVVMPEHLHFILVVHNSIISALGRQTHLGQVIAGFKKGCNRRYWDLIGLQGKPAEADTSSRSAVPPQDSPSPRPAVSPQRPKVPSNYNTGRTPLFSYGYVDVMPLKEGQLEQQRHYIRNNPRNRLLRMNHRACLQTQRLAVPTALSLKALHGYLQKECPSWQFHDETWAGLQQLLQTKDGQVMCDCYGNSQLLPQRLLPVVCHRKDTCLFEQQKEKCLSAAKEGAVLVSAHIAKGERAIIDAAVELGLPVIIIIDNGFPNIYHPSERYIQQCTEGKLLIISPWQYHYRHAGETISVAECKTMNCVAQALCRTKDSWWMNSTELALF